MKKEIEAQRGNFLSIAKQHLAILHILHSSYSFVIFNITRQHAKIYSPKSMIVVYYIY